MPLTIGSNTPKPVFPLQGIGEYFEKIGKLSNAKHAYKKALESPLATNIDKANAKYSISKVDEKLRSADESKVDVTTSVMLPIKDLTQHPDVEMPMSSQDYKRIKEDIAERGIKVPLAIDTQNRVVCGIHRFRAASDLGLKEVPCFILGITSPTDIKRYAMADNVCRRQLTTKEKKAWVVALLRLRKEESAHIRGRKKGGPKKKGELASNRDIAKDLGVSDETVNRLEKELTATDVAVKTTPLVPPRAPRTSVNEDYEKAICWGKSKIADDDFGRIVLKEVGERIEYIRSNASKVDKLKFKVRFHYND